MTLSDSRRHRRPRRRRGRDPRAERASPDDPRHPSGVPCPLPRWTAAGASVGCFPAACSLPRFPAGSASTTSLSRPAQASLALRPAGSLSRPRRPSSRGFDPPGCPGEPLVSYQINRQLPGWNLPPLATRAVWHAVLSYAEWNTGQINVPVAVLAEATHMLPNEVYRALSTLVEFGAMVRTGRGRYALNPNAAWSGSLVERGGKAAELTPAE
jgi:hypothetical protein